MSGVISPLIWIISIVTLPITLLRTTHEPPSRQDLATKAELRSSHIAARSVSPLLAQALIKALKPPMCGSLVRAKAKS